MTNQTNESSFAGVVMAMLVVLAAGPAYADDHDDLRKVKMKFAGSLLLNVEQQQVDINGVPLGSTALIGFSHTKAVGNLGRADIMVVTNTGPPSLESK